MRGVLLLVVVASGCASTSYVVERAPLETARARGERNARVPAQLSGSGAPVYVDAGAVHDDGGDGRAHIINRTMITGYVLIGVGGMHLIPGAALIAVDSSCHGSDGCGFLTIAGGFTVAFGALFAVVGLTMVLVGQHAHPHEWPRTPRAAYLGSDGALHF
jgi:hypothetical protein